MTILSSATLITKDGLKTLSTWRPPTLTSERLLLRPLELADAEAIFNYAKDPQVSLYTLWEPHQSLSDSISYIKDYAFKFYADKEPEPFGVCLKERPEKVIGTVGCFWVSEEHRTMELAYALSRDHWGKGFMPEAALLMLNYCFQEFKPVRIQARCKSENLASARVMEKIGMRFEGTSRRSLLHREKHWDMHVYSIFADELE